MGIIWTLSEALAWVIWRNIGAVQRATQGKLTCMELMNIALREADGDPASWDKAEAARQDFFRALCHGQITAAGVSDGGVQVTPVPKEVWRGVETMHQFVNGFGPAEIGASSPDGKAIVLYREVTLLSEDIQKIWKEHPNRLVPRKVPASPEVRKFIQKLVDERGKSLTQVEGIEKVRAQFPGVTRDSIVAIIRELTGNDKPGPRGPRK